MEHFTDQVAVITGAASGIGRALVDRAAAEGMRIALADIEPDALNRALSEVADTGTTAIAQVVDVGDRASVDAFADRVYAELGGCHLLCNNAGVFAGGFLWDRTDADFEWVFRVNLWGILNGIRAFVPRMIAAGVPGHIVNTSSIAGLFGSGYSGTYNISKFAAFAATESLANDLAAIGAPIGASVLCPSATDTAIGKSGRNRPDAFQSPVTEDAAFVEQMLNETTAAGVPPAAMADAAFRGIAASQFLITATDSYHAAYRERCETLLAGGIPSTMPTN